MKHNRYHETLHYINLTLKYEIENMNTEFYTRLINISESSFKKTF